uniref:Putative acetylcholinesterase/butyrylcholinesterase n=2 Tax=Ixodes ricinus TaxID=34613 RepID=V5H4P2_IXORI
MKATWIPLLLMAICSLCESTNPTVRTKNGDVEGLQLNVYGESVHAFLGIPYARPPIGNLRFQRPLPKAPWSKVKKTRTFGKRCLQEAPLDVPSDPYAPVPKMGEDCLYLNIWSPVTPNNSKAVMVWVHGGEFKEGSSDNPFFDGSVLAATQGVVVVSFNYRLGFLGFLNAVNVNASGNAGLYDQVLALAWIKDNIEAFGGNASRVTLFGEDAGSMAIRLHIFSPVTRGLFQRVIMQGGAFYASRGVESTSRGLLKADALAVEVGCSKSTHSLVSHPHDVLECLKSRPALELVSAQAELHLQGIESPLPTYGTEFLPQNPDLIFALKGFTDAEILMGHNDAEGRKFIFSVLDGRFESLRKQNNMTVKDGEVALHVLLSALGYRRPSASEIVQQCLGSTQPCDPSGVVEAVERCAKDFAVLCPSVALAYKLADAGLPTYYYAISYIPADAETYLRNHVDRLTEASLVFGSPSRFPGKYEESDRTFSNMLMNIWAQFAKDGKPPAVHGTLWPPFSEAGPLYVELGPAKKYLKQIEASLCKQSKK